MRLYINIYFVYQLNVDFFFLNLIIIIKKKSIPWIQPGLTQLMWVRLGWIELMRWVEVGLGWTELMRWIGLKNLLNPAYSHPYHGFSKKKKKKQNKSLNHKSNPRSRSSQSKLNPNTVNTEQNQTKSQYRGVYWKKKKKKTIQCKLKPNSNTVQTKLTVTLSLLVVDGAPSSST